MRATIECVMRMSTCGPAVVAGHRIDEYAHSHPYKQPRYCAKHAVTSTGDGLYAYLPLVNPGTAPEADIIAAEIAILALERLLEPRARRTATAQTRP